MENQPGLKAMFRRRATSALIDVVFICCMSFLVHLLILQFVFIDPFPVFEFTWIAYYSGCYVFLQGRTLAKCITGLQLVANDSEKAGPGRVFIREVVCKFLLLLAIPGYIVTRLHIYRQSELVLPASILAAFFVVMVVLFFVFKRPWWELLSSTKTIRHPEARRTLRFVSFLVIAVVFGLSFFIKINPVFKVGSDFKTTFYPEYPANAEVRDYAGFIKTHAQNPVDYIFDLFDKYDLVVLNERVPHSEYTQYEFFENIIRDKRFAGKIGNLYTELGSASFQDTLNTYLNTVYPNEDSLNRATAYLQRNSNPIWPLWNCTNLFDFLKVVNRLNSSSADSLKIRWYFTDIPCNWETMTPGKWQNLKNIKRDSIMAGTVIGIYKNKLANHERRTKGLVIMNARHGYGLIRDRNGKKTNHHFNKSNTTAFLMDLLPGKVGNVMINTAPFGVGVIYAQVQHGKWDKAFAVCGNPNVGFNFENSPFGNDKFDVSIGNPPDGLTYKDVFTGFVFYKPFKKHVNKIGAPYMLYNFEDSLVRRATCISPAYAESMKGMIRMYDNDKVFAEIIPYAIYYNLVWTVGFSLVVFLTFLISLIVYLKEMD